jgi:hypothetical protein
MHIICVFVSLYDCEQPENGLNLVEACSCNCGFYDKSLFGRKCLHSPCSVSWLLCPVMSNILMYFSIKVFQKGPCFFVCMCESLNRSFACSEGVWGSRGIDPLILIHDTRWIWVVSFMPQVLYHRGEHKHCPLIQRLGGPLGQSGCFREDINLLPMLGVAHKIVQPVASYCTSCALLAFFFVSKFLHFDLH